MIGGKKKKVNRRRAKEMADRIFKVARVGTEEMAVEIAEDERAACYKLGWAPEWCKTEDITDDLITLIKDGVIQIQFRLGPAEVLSLDRMLREKK